jgi:hypothetical protein
VYAQNASRYSPHTALAWAVLPFKPCYTSRARNR